MGRTRRNGTLNFRLLLAGILLWPLPAGAVELHYNHVDKGTAGLSHVPLTVRNTGVAPLSCTVQLAHWYSISMADAAPGGTTLIDLWFDPAKGAYLLLNAGEDNMPVEALWCGIAGRAYETRTAILLDRAKGGTPKPEDISCAASEDRLTCD